MHADPAPLPRRTRHVLRRSAHILALGAVVTLTAAACGEALPDPVPGQSPAAYSGLGVSEDRIDYAIGKVSDIVSEEMDASGIPGAAVAVVHGGEVAFSDGFGVRSTSTGAEVDTNTVFPLASLSKPVSATVVAAESANGAVDWTTPAREYLPWFALSDPRITPMVTVGDLFSHRSGLPEHAGDDLEDLGYDRAAILHGLRHLPLNEFRSSYAYTNFGLTAGAEAVAMAAGMPWAELADERVFEPLGMTETSYSHDVLLDHPDRAVGHMRTTEPTTSPEPATSVEATTTTTTTTTDPAQSSDSSAPAASSASSAPTEPTTPGELTETAESSQPTDKFDPSDSPGPWTPADPGRNPDAQAPAGGLSSSVTDMARWMSMVLANGKSPDGEQVVPVDALREALTPQVTSSPPSAAGDRTGSYGYGFNISDTSSGRVQWSHSGAFVQGAGTAMLMIPSLDLGIITLTNASPVGAAETINARFADLAQYGDPAQDWGSLYSEAFRPLLAPAGDLAGDQRPFDPEPSRPVEELVGTYRSDYFGPLEVTRTGDDLALRLGQDRESWPLQSWDGDMFAVSPTGENWPAGTRGSVLFDDDEVTVTLLNDNGLGTFTRTVEASEDGEASAGEQGTDGRADVTEPSI